VDVASGSEHVVPLSPSAGVLGLAWLDVNSILLNHVAEDGQPAQMWRVAYPGGKLSRLTNDLSRYVGVSVTADRGSLVTAQYTARSSVWIGDAAGQNGDESLTIERSRAIVAWAGERLLYMTEGGIMSVLPGRGAPEQVVPRGGFPAASANGRTIVFISAGEGAARLLSKADADGRNAVQLLSGSANQPTLALDDRLVVFTSVRGGQQTVRTIPIDGGMPTEIVKEFATGLSVSPDGRSLLFGTQGDEGRVSLVICDLPTCDHRRNIARPDGTGFRWAPDGKGIAYRDTATQANLWVQPLDGTGPHQLTHFATDRTINDYAWSHDGKRLAVARESVTNDIVLFKGLQKVR